MTTATMLAMETAALTKRWFLHTARQPIAVAASLFQPLIWLFLFGSLFRFVDMPLGSLALGRAEGAGYLPFLVAGVVVFTAFNSALSTGVPVLFDKENRFLDRLLVAPLHSRYSIVAASAIHIFVMSTAQTLLVLGVAAWFSPYISVGPLELMAILGIVALLIAAFTSLSLALAFALRAHFEMLSFIQVVALPLMFMSTAFAPLEVMPGWLQWVASLNPLTMAIEPVRHLLLGGGLGDAGILVAAPWANLGFGGCLLYLAAANAAVLLPVALLLRKTLR
jgi:ABC-2 type transport system permease protein